MPKKESSTDDLVVERDQHNLNKAQPMLCTLCFCRGCFFGGDTLNLIFLSDRFYQLYADAPEILQKKDRPYACLAVRINGLVYAIPFRHHISHKYAFFTGKGIGLDYTKAVIIKEQGFIGQMGVQVNQDEYNAIKGKEHRIVSGMRNFVSVYKKALRYPANKAYDNIRRCSALQYFPEYFNR